MSKNPYTNKDVFYMCFCMKPFIRYNYFSGLGVACEIWRGISTFCRYFIRFGFFEYLQQQPPEIDIHKKNSKIGIFQVSQNVFQ